MCARWGKRIISLNCKTDNSDEALVFRRSSDESGPLVGDVSSGRG